MPKRVPVEAKRVPLNCLVLPETKAWLKSLDGSEGSIVDRAVAALRVRESHGRAQTGAITSGLPVVVSTTPRFKPPLLKPSEKKK